MSARIKVEIENESAREISLGALFRMGRGPGNDLVVNDSRASRNHAVIQQQDRSYYLLDLGSSNGTLVNGRRVMIPLALKSGDEVVIASYRIVFEQDESSQPEENMAGDDMRTQVELTSNTVSILVIDIRNYTALTEAIPDDKLAHIIGKWFQESNVVIENHGGRVVKFIGDAIMAYWEKVKTESEKNYITGPIKAAVDLVHLAKLFDQQLFSSFPDYHFNIGCGIHTGKALAQKMGVTPDFIGDSVNVAFRLESLCKELDRSIVVSEEIKKAVSQGFNFEDLGLQKVKGKSQDIQVYAVGL